MKSVNDKQRMQMYVDKTISLHQALNNRDRANTKRSDINEQYDVFFAHSKDISDGTKNLFKHELGTVGLHDGFLKVASEKKRSSGYHTSLNGYGLLYSDEGVELGRTLVNIELVSSKPLREINNKEIYTFSFLNNQLGIVYHQDGKLRSLASQVDNLQIDLGPLKEYKRQPPQDLPATISITLRDWKNTQTKKAPQRTIELDAIWSSNREAYVLMGNEKIAWPNYDLSNLGFIERSDISLKEDPSVRSKLKQDNDDDYFNTNGSIQTYLKSKTKLSSYKKAI